MREEKLDEDKKNSKNSEAEGSQGEKDQIEIFLPHERGRTEVGGNRWQRFGGNCVN